MDDIDAREVQAGDVLRLEEMIEVMGKSGKVIKHNKRAIFFAQGDYESAKAGARVRAYVSRPEDPTQSTVRAVNFSFEQKVSPIIKKVDLTNFQYS